LPIYREHILNLTAIYNVREGGFKIRTAEGGHPQRGLGHFSPRKVLILRSSDTEFLAF